MWGIVCGAFLAAPCGLVAAADLANPAVEPQESDTVPSDPLDAIIVNAQREKLSVLRKEIEQSEDAVYDAFNAANTIPEYRTHCSIEKNSIGGDYEHVGRWHQHICKPEFVETATSIEAQAIVNGWPYKPASMVINAKMLDYRQHVRDVAHKDPKLRKALGHYNAVTDRYDALWKAKFKGKWLVWD